MRIPGDTQTNSKRRFPPGAPRYAERAAGPWVWCDDGKKYLDMVSGLGAVILGHDDLEVGLAAAVQQGVSMPLPTRLEGEVAELLAEMIPSAEMTRFAKNGADATAAAVRLARAVTGREAILRCGYHGYQDWCVQNSKGVPEQDVWAVEFNDLRDLEWALTDLRPAAFILEPILHHPAPAALPQPGYLQAVIDLCHRYGALCVFDETVTGFRFGLGGAQAKYGVVPDLTCIGKALANGYPLSALCGKAEYMKLLGDGSVFFSTTHGGETVSLAAAKATLTALQARKVPEKLHDFGVAIQGATYLPLYGLPARWDYWWPEAEKRDAFAQHLLKCDVLALGAFTLTEAMVENEEVWERLECVFEF